jgi:flagellar biosynthetic protein FliR
MDWLIDQWLRYLLVVLRTGAILVFWPLWNHRLLTTQIKVFSILVISLALTPVVSPFLPAFPRTWPGIAGLVLQELLLGMTLGLTIRFIFAGMQMAGTLAATQMGLGMVTLYDPQSRAQTTAIADLLIMLATLIFLSLDGHHMILRLLVQSFQDTPMAVRPGLPWALFYQLSAQAILIYQWAIKLAAPILAALFLTQLALGLVARAVPQIQIMIVSFPLTIALGLFFLSVTLLSFTPFLGEQLAGLKGALPRLLQAWQG